MCPPFDFGNRTIIKDGVVLMQGMHPDNLDKSALISTEVCLKIPCVPNPEVITLDDSVLIALISRAIRSHNLAAQLIEANVYWNLFGQLQDSARNYRIYTQQVCTGCGKVSNHISSNLITSRCWICAESVDPELHYLPDVLATESNLCDTLEFSLAKLTQESHDLLMEYLSHA